VIPEIEGWTARRPLADPPVEPGHGRGRWVITTTTDEEHLARAVAAVREAAPQAEIAFLAQSDLVPHLRRTYPECPLLDSPRNGFFGMDITLGLIRRLHRARPERFLILYRNRDGSRHKRAELLALLSGAWRIYGYDVEARWWELPHRFLSFNLIRPVLESKPVKLLRALAYNISFAVFLALQDLALRLTRRYKEPLDGA
jgi:hypothetical protein